MKYPPQDQLVMGLHAIQELLHHAPHRLLRIYTVRPQEKRKSQLLEECERNQIPISFVANDELSKMAGSDSHQSFVAHVKGRTYYGAEKVF